MSDINVSMIEFICLHDLFEVFPKGRWSDNPSPIVLRLVNRGYIDKVGEHFTLSKAGKEVVENLIQKHKRKDKFQKLANEVKVDDEGGVTVTKEQVKGFFDV